jgi:hypothetical protein
VSQSLKPVTFIRFRIDRTLRKRQLSIHWRLKKLTYAAVVKQLTIIQKYPICLVKAAVTDADAATAEKVSDQDEWIPWIPVAMSDQAAITEDKTWQTGIERDWG